MDGTVHIEKPLAVHRALGLRFFFSIIPGYVHNEKNILKSLCFVIFPKLLPRLNYYARELCIKILCRIAVSQITYLSL